MNPTHVMGRRVIAFIIDYVLLSVAFAALFYALGTHTTHAVHLTGSHVTVTFDKDTYYVRGDDATRLYVIEVAVALLYAGIIQGLTGGTIGKLICGIRVMREDGRRPGLGRGVLRWLLLIVDDFPYFIPMLTGFIVALTNDRRRRVGDMAAGTFVVRAGTDRVPLPAAAMARAAVAEPEPAAAPPPEPQPDPKPLPSASWYPDPSGQARLRYWDGARWTNHTAQ
jgi:uncharacterized RDD family membrane protein YckC